jgi:flagellar biosynthesis/type III secretory pathway protein FliH
MTEHQQRADDIYEALKERFARAWDDGYAQGVEDAQDGALGAPQNPWRMPL